MRVYYQILPSFLKPQAEGIRSALIQRPRLGRGGGGLDGRKSKYRSILRVKNHYASLQCCEEYQVRMLSRGLLSSGRAWDIRSYYAKLPVSDK